VDSDRCVADHDTINQVANVSLRSSAVRGQPAEGLRHESFDIGGWNVRIPRQSGQGFRFDVGHRSDLIPATIPK